jgi:hypothetical protein
MGRGTLQLQQQPQQQQWQQQAKGWVLQQENARLRVRLVHRDEQFQQLLRQMQEAHGGQQ